MRNTEINRLYAESDERKKSARMTVEGERTKRFRIIWIGGNNNELGCEAEYDFVEEARVHKFTRHDRHYRIRFDGKNFTAQRFAEWANQQSAGSR
jgi:hypothetical protein